MPAGLITLGRVTALESRATPGRPTAGGDVRGREGRSPRWRVGNRGYPSCGTESVGRVQCLRPQIGWPQLAQESS
jgi:hypothetical protein